MKKGREKRVGILFFLVVIIGLAVLFFPKPEGERGLLFDKEKKKVKIFFVDKEEGLLVSEERSITKSKKVVDETREIIKELLTGPTCSWLQSAIPEAVKLREVYIYKQIAYIDLSKEVAENHPGGSQAELCTIYSIVNSLCLNLPELSGVKILVEGKSPETLAGHIALDEPFIFNEEMVKR
ncbi:GerMN domain-containing protein [bacterium]|nr:GerMN domain-containing protein [bacterium]MBU1599893.1 GerMN domain-containing protein [bacterium]MBU2461356.1 GerMN domain-containing protein [bacterium]